MIKTLTSTFVGHRPRLGIVILALILAVATGFGDRAAKAQSLGYMNLIPVAVSPAAVAVPPAGVDFIVTVTIQASTFDFAPSVAAQLIGLYPTDVSQTIELQPDDWQCPVSVPAGDSGTCTITLHASGGAPATSEQHWVIIADTTGPADPIGGTTAPITVTYSEEPSYDPGPGGKVSWSQPSGIVAVDVTTPTGGEITISDTASGGGTAEYELIGQTIDITAPSASQGQPLRLEFRLDATEAAAQGVTESNAVVLRSGSEVPPCNNMGTGVADPQPRCVDVRERIPAGDPDGDIKLVVRAEQASPWNLARLRPYQVEGFVRPVKEPPALNVGRAGARLPVRFGLGGDRGLNIFAAGSPQSQRIDCPADPAEVSIVPGTPRRTGPSLIYRALTDRYTYLWDTERSWNGTCRRLTLGFKDGKVRALDFRFVARGEDSDQDSTG